MSIRIQQLNGDTTFLLTFSPPFAPEISKRYPGDYIILLDPWLQGCSSYLHPKFQISHHTLKPALNSLSELKQQPDIIIISQDKPDHCHKETLCSLPRDTEINILATPAAAKKIRSWRHFPEEAIHTMDAFSASDPDTVIRISLPGFSASCTDGEITIANLPSKRDVAGVHNAIGITYQPATTVLTKPSTKRRRIRHPNPDTSTSTFTLPDRGVSSAPASRHRSSTFSSAKHDAALYSSTSAQSQPEFARPSPRSSSTIPEESEFDLVPTEEVLSVVYTPHGIPTHTLDPYLAYHLAPLDALPVSALFHGTSMEANPWFMGGVVANGAPGGVDIAKRVGAKYWINAHDEAKDNRGLSVLLLKTRRFSTREVEGMLAKAGAGATVLCQLGMQEVLRIPELKKTVEDVRRSRLGEGRVLRPLKMDKAQRMNVEDNVLAMPEPKWPLITAAETNGDVEERKGSIAPGTQVRIRREITDPLGRWI